MEVRGWRERAAQTVAYEVGALVLVTPLWSWATGETARESLGLLVGLSFAAVALQAVYHDAFDRLEWRWHGRRASDRPALMRAGHAVGAELWCVVGTWPLVAWHTGHGWADALVLDLGLTAAYSAYGVLFHWAFDTLRPVAGRGNDAAPAARAERPTG